MGFTCREESRRRLSCWGAMASAAGRHAYTSPMPGEGGRGRGRGEMMSMCVCLCVFLSVCARLGLLILQFLRCLFFGSSSEKHEPLLCCCCSSFLGLWSWIPCSCLMLACATFALRRNLRPAHHIPHVNITALHSRNSRGPKTKTDRQRPIELRSRFVKVSAVYECSKQFDSPQ